MLPEVISQEGAPSPNDSATCDIRALPESSMEIVGPLPKSRSGNRYILVMCDYATHYPEAVPLKSIDTENIAEELVKIFSRVGIPREILTD